MALIFFFLINIDSAHTVAEMTAQSLPLFTTNRLQSGPKLTLTAHSYKKKTQLSSYHINFNLLHTRPFFVPVCFVDSILTFESIFLRFSLR